jgi:GGDEF domain-containing protein
MATVARIGGDEFVVMLSGGYLASNRNIHNLYANRFEAQGIG